jgi:hypothetical protein
MRALDYSGWIPGRVLRQANITHVFRYLGDPNVWPKVMTRAEVTDLKLNEIKIHLNYEQQANFMMGGYSAGKSFALEARKWANYLGFDANEPIIYSDDVQSNAAQVQTALSFLDGAASVDGGKSNVGGYGEYDFVKTAIDHGYIGWQTEAWSGGKFDSRAIAWQMGGQLTLNGNDADLNTMNSSYISAGGPMSNQIPPSIGAKWKPIAGEFTGSYDDSTAIIWADAGARYAAFMADQIWAKLETMTSTPPPVTQPVNLTLTEADYDAIAKAIVKRMGTDLSAG